MKKLLLVLVLLGACLASGVLLAQESIPPVQVGGGQSAARITNGQTVEVSAAGVAVSVNFTEISADRVTGVAVRTSGGTSAGTVTIRWVNRGHEVSLRLGPSTPEVPFGMEGGDIDRRTINEYSDP